MCIDVSLLQISFPVRSPREGGTLQVPLCPPPRPVPRNYKGKTKEWVDPLLSLCPAPAPPPPTPALGSSREALPLEFRPFDARGWPQTSHKSLAVMQHQPFRPLQLDALGVPPHFAPVRCVPRVAELLAFLLRLLHPLVAQSLVGAQCSGDLHLRRDGWVRVRERKTGRERASVLDGLAAALDAGGEEGVRCVSEQTGASGGRDPCGQWFAVHKFPVDTGRSLRYLSPFGHVSGLGGELDVLLVVVVCVPRGAGERCAYNCSAPGVPILEYFQCHQFYREGSRIPRYPPRPMRTLGG
jgi:hypothetical protein